MNGSDSDFICWNITAIIQFLQKNNLHLFCYKIGTTK